MPFQNKIVPYFEMRLPWEGVWEKQLDSRDSRSQSWTIGALCGVGIGSGKRWNASLAG